MQIKKLISGDTICAEVYTQLLKIKRGEVHLCRMGWITPKVFQMYVSKFSKISGAKFVTNARRAPFGFVYVARVDGVNPQG